MDLTLLFQVAVAVLVAGTTGAVGWLVRSVSANTRRTDAHEARLATIDMDSLDGRIDKLAASNARMDARLDAVDNSLAEVAVIHRRVDDLVAGVGRLQGEMAALARSVNMLIDALVRRDVGGPA